MTVTRVVDPRPSGGERRASQRILVVDDEPGIRRLTARILEEEGYLVHEVGDGREALEFIEQGELVDAVVSDIVMPHLNGVELLEALTRSHPTLPIVLMSGYGMEELARRGIASPCAILSKPFTPDRLISEVRRCIAERQ